MNEWPAAVWASVSAMTAALVLSLIFLLGSFAREAVAIQQTDDNAIALIKEYRKYSRYNGTTDLVPADVITAIAETRGQPEIWVDAVSGSNVSFDLKWSTQTPSNMFKTDVLVYAFELLDKQNAGGNSEYSVGKYDATIVKDPNGAVIRIEFRRQ